MERPQSITLTTLRIRPAGVFYLRHGCDPAIDAAHGRHKADTLRDKRMPAGASGTECRRKRKHLMSKQNRVP